MDLMPLALPQEPAGGIAEWAADPVDTMGGPGAGLAIALAFVFGYSLTLFVVMRAGLSLKAAVEVAPAADTVSIAVMELVDNAVVALTPGAMEAQLSDGVFWYALLGGFAVAFVITTPVNKWVIGRGRGHAVVHAHH
ncbi:DUF4396 domain-containing protein [Streptomyces sp. NPDC050388]|uniref:DUF4396 domain-containing protein n=1 Tax=Streptomyces sp. NPDC050388 TaxID=3155781 RepID=UPI003440EB4B